MVRFRGVLLLALTGLVALPACGEPPQKTEEPEEPPAKPRPRVKLKGLLPAKVQEVFDGACVRCHGGKEPAARLDLRYYVAYGNLIGQRSWKRRKLELVVPGKPETSYLIHKMKGTHRDVRGRGVRMPKDGTFGPDGDLTDAMLAQVERWVRDGAKKAE